MVERLVGGVHYYNGDLGIEEYGKELESLLRPLVLGTRRKLSTTLH